MAAVGGEEFNQKKNSASSSFSLPMVLCFLMSRQDKMVIHVYCRTVVCNANPSLDESVPYRGVFYLTVGGLSLWAGTGSNS